MRFKLGIPDLKQRWRSVKSHDSRSSMESSLIMVSQNVKLSKPEVSFAVIVSEE